jgi:hypothetical protein
MLAALALLLFTYAFTQWFALPGVPAVVRPPGASKKPEAKAGPPIVVVGADGAEEPVADLSQAIEKAIGSRGSVVLRDGGRDALTFSTPERAIALLADGWLTIKAAAGANPTLIVDMKGPDPFLTTGARMRLSLEGLTIVARYPGQAPGKDPAPLMNFAGDAHLRHCTLRVENRRGPAGSRALLSDGGKLIVENCFFAGFDTALEAHAVGGSTTSLSQTMIVPAALQAPVRVPPPDGPAWGLKMVSMSGGAAGATRKLILDHCTVVGSGFLRLAGFGPQSRLSVESRGCAVRAEAMVDWEPAGPDAPLDPRSIDWSGRGDQLDITGGSWVVTSAAATAPEPTEKIDDLEGWSKVAVETDPVRASLHFKGGAATGPGTPRPEDFTILSAGPVTAGADPARVGPMRGTRPRSPAP